jgi:hypothetical protein
MVGKLVRWYSVTSIYLVDIVGVCVLIFSKCNLGCVHIMIAWLGASAISTLVRTVVSRVQVPVAVEGVGHPGIRKSHVTILAMCPSLFGLDDAYVSALDACQRGVAYPASI